MANVLNIPLPEENEEKCVICQEELSNRQAYTLPECGHTFHTECIVTWFRHRPSSQDELLPDGSCPCCCNKGINYVFKSRIWTRSRLKTEFYKSRYKMMCDEQKKPSCPKQLLQLFKKLKTAKQNLKTTIDSCKQYKQIIKNTDVNFEETKKKLSEFRNSRWKKERSVNSIKDAIVFFPIVNLIIPTRIEI